MREKVKVFQIESLPQFPTAIYVVKEHEIYYEYVIFIICHVPYIDIEIFWHN